MSNTIDNNFAIIAIMTHETNKRWIEEINSNGLSFDYDSQDIFREHMQVANSLKYKEILEHQPKSEWRQLALKELPIRLKKTVFLYESYKSIFDSYDRQKLQVDVYRKVKNSNSTDTELNIEILQYTELMNRDQYYDSDFYQNIGFLTTNFHEYIYFFSKKFISDLENDFANDIQYDSDYFIKNKTAYFSMEIIGKVHAACNDILFEHSSEIDLYNELNFFNPFSKIKLKSKQNIKVCFLIFNLSRSIDEKKRHKWIIDILRNFRIEKNYYDSKYKEILKIDSLQDFKDQIDLIFKDFKTK